jgi:hypothetical protein
MLLIITNSGDVTADYLCGRLDEHSIGFQRLDTDRCLDQVVLSYSISTPVLRCEAQEWAAGDFAHVWFRRPLPLRLGIEMEDAERSHTLAEWSEALEGFLGHIPLKAWMNHPSCNVRASHKMEQLTRAASFGLAVPPTIVSQDADRVRSFWTECDGRMIVKPLASGYVERQSPSDDTVIYANRVPESALGDLSLVSRCPTLFQQELVKRLDVRLCVVDDRVVASGLVAKERGEQRLDIRRRNMRDVSYVQVEPPPDVELALLGLVRSYGLRFAAVDMAVAEDGRWFFFEINPNGQWAWLDISGGFDVGQLFVQSFSRP